MSVQQRTKEDGNFFSGLCYIFCASQEQTIYGECFANGCETVTMVRNK